MGRVWAVQTSVLAMVAVGAIFATSVYAHGGGLDRCGGHNDRKRGGYHIHRMAQYCVCHPEEQACKELRKAPSKDDKAKPRAPAAAEILTGRVVGVADGDTVTVLDSANVQHKIRLGGIDAPEEGQAFGNVSRQHLAELVFGKQAEAACYKIDRHKRLVCTVYIDGKDVGLAQLDAGLAWWYRHYANEQPPQERLEYEIAENRAAADRVGLWRDRSPVPPWEWRDRGRNKRSNGHQL